MSINSLRSLYSLPAYSLGRIGGRGGRFGLDCFENIESATDCLSLTQDSPQTGMVLF